MKRYGYIGLLQFVTAYERKAYKKTHVEQEEKLIKVSDTLVIDMVFRTTKPMKVDKLIATLEQSDIVVITDLKYLAHNMPKLLERLNAIEDKGATLEVLDIKRNSLAGHANAIAEFNKFIRGTKISKGMITQAQIKRSKGEVNDSRSLIQDWYQQHAIALARSTGEKTVQELADEHEVERQVIYRICKKEEFKNVKPLKYNFEDWDLDKCIKNTTPHIQNSEKGATVVFFMGQYNIVIHAYRTKEKEITYPEARAHFSAIPRENLKVMYDLAVLKTKLEWELEKRKKEAGEYNIKPKEVSKMN
jgi:DNA invertase Pin-like site-specific DNA recombinase